jgi:hypothetical protein
MTPAEYKAVLTDLSDEQRRALNEHIGMGNQPTVEQMLATMEKYQATVEPGAVFWLNRNVTGRKVITEAGRVADLARRGHAIAIISLILAVLALLKTMFH